MHAWIGVGSLKPLKEVCSSAGTFNCEKSVTGVTAGTPGGVVMVIECLARKAAASASDARADADVGGAGVDTDVDAAAGEGEEEEEGVGSEAGVEVEAEAEAESVLCFFLCFFSFFGSEASWSSVSRFRFFFFSFFSSPVLSVVAERH